MMNRISDVQLKTHMEGKRLWKLDASSEQFTAKSITYTLTARGEGMNKEAYELIWKGLTQMKFRFLTWLVWSHKVSVTEVLQRRRPDLSISPHRCTLCGNNGETIDLHCGFPKFMDKAGSRVEYGVD
ncbi:hypothetical protein Scep_010692 [Stephania cephalantha]|uniref:Reverse transcriptase zinc-binding domain-containing protein n=1 Tax=Stephania cephalantha TaxID=152367 RepID=A0AAP0PHH5_9MAGN